MIIQVTDRNIELDDNLRFATKVQIQQTILEKMAFVADTPEALDELMESEDVFKLFDLTDWYKIIFLQSKTNIEPSEFYMFSNEDIEQLKKKWNLLSVFAEMRSEFIKNYSIRIKLSLNNILKPVKQAD